jgi:hypothetical protein
MAQVKEKCAKDEAYVLGEIYKNTKMGADAIINLLPHVKEDAIRSLMTQQLDGYEKYAHRAAERLREMGETPREEGVLTRVSARIGMAFSTLMDSTTGHIAEMMIEGSNMGITDMTRLLNTYQGTTSAEEGVRLAREVVNFEERNLEMMNRFL